MTNPKPRHQPEKSWHEMQMDSEEAKRRHENIIAAIEFGALMGFVGGILLVIYTYYCQ